MLEKTITVSIKTDQIIDDVAFHSVFKDTLGFPDFYGSNMDAWIDCMSSVDCTESGLTKIIIEEGNILMLDLINFEDFQSRCPEIVRSFLDCLSFVNTRLRERRSAIAVLL